MRFGVLNILFRELIGKFADNYRAMDWRKRLLFFSFTGTGLAIGFVISWFLEHPSRGFGFALIVLVVAFAIYNIGLVPVLVYRENVRRRTARRD